jgi:fumarate reductase flavoprotein subunit
LAVVKVKTSIRSEKLKADVVVIGGGGTGFAAAVTAAEKGARVILAEKRRAPGGTTMFAEGLFASESPVHKRLSLAALKDDVFKIAMDYSHWTINPRVFRSFVDKSGDTISWLESKGLAFNHIYNLNPSIEAMTFHSLGRDKKTGPVIIRTLQKNCEDLGVEVLLNCPAKKILTNRQGEVTGVLAAGKDGEFTINSKSVIIATGGYSGNKELLKRYYPAYHENLVSLGASCNGDGLMMALEAGAAPDQLGVLLMHPHYYKGPVQVDALAQEPATVWVNKKGERFADEAITFRAAECGNAVNRQPDKCCFVLFDAKIKKRIEEQGFIRGGVHGIHIAKGVPLTDLQEVLKQEAVKGGVAISDSWVEIAAWMQTSPENLQNTIKEYNQCCDQGHDDTFNKEKVYLQPLQTPPFYAIRCFSSCLDTIGGIKINHRMEVLSIEDNPIRGLYAGGNAAGGWEGDTYCMLLPGSACGFAINSGRIAGENAAQYALET